MSERRPERRFRCPTCGAVQPVYGRSAEVWHWCPATHPKRLVRFLEVREEGRA